jgi:hypothetical protein
MIKNIGPLIGADELLNHQVPMSFAMVSVPDYSWTEKIWTTLIRRDGSLQVDAGLGKYPNRNVIDGFGGISRGREQRTVRASRQLDSAPESTSVGPLHYEVLDPLKSVRFAMHENDAQPVRYEVSLEGTMPPFFEKRHYGIKEGRVNFDVVRYHQAVVPSGFVEIDGERIPIAPEEWYGFRDHSWGIRDNVGERPRDLAPSDRSGYADYLMHWSPMVLERPNGERYEVQYYLIKSKGSVDHFSGFINHPDGRQDPILEAMPELTYDEKTGDAIAGPITLILSGGEKRVLEVTPFTDTGFRLHPALYAKWNGAHHGTWRGEAHVEGERIEDCEVEYEVRKNPAWQLRDRPVRVREGDATGFGILEHFQFGS